MQAKWLTSIAAAALIAGSGAALAQSPAPGGSEKSPGMNQGGGTAAPERAPSPQQSAPAEKVAPPAGTTGQSPSSGERAPGAAQSGDSAPKSGATPRASDQNGSKSPSATQSQDKSKPGSAAQGDTKSGATTGQGAAGTSANLTTEQKTKISTTIKQQNIRPVTNVNFSLAIGSTVPRTVELHTLPANVIEIYPAWRGYRFVLVKDEIVIIDPDTFRIVAIIEA